MVEKQIPSKGRQTPGEQMAAFARALTGKQQTEIHTDQLREADKKVGASSKQRLSWAIDFAQKPNDQMALGDWYNAQIELGAFLNPWFKTEFADRTKKALQTFPFSPVWFPSVEQVKAIKERFLSMLKSASLGLQFSIEASAISIDVGRQIGKSRISYSIPIGDLRSREKQKRAKVENASLKLALLIADQWDYIGHCEKHEYGCGRYFRKSRIDRKFCSKRCLNRATTYRQRKKAKQKKSRRNR